MTIVYKCDFCGEIFRDETKCKEHELNFHTVENTKKRFVLLSTHMSNPHLICEHCKNHYYVYGCELSCRYNFCGCNRENDWALWEKEDGVK